MMEIIPDILEQSVFEIEAKIKRVRGLIDRVHIDVIDGIYADNLTVMPSDLGEIDFSGLKIDFHILTEEPIDYVEDVMSLKDKAVSGLRLIGQIERMSKQDEFVSKVKEFKCEVGLALDLYTPITSIEKEIYKALDCVLLMSVKAGFSRQKFQPSVLTKIKKIMALGFDKKIIIDGGMNLETASMVREAGATEFAVNSFLWHHKDIKKVLEEF